MKYKTYDPKTKKAEWIDEDECGNAEGLSFLEYLEKHGKIIKNPDPKETREMEKAFSELEDDESTKIETKDI